MVFICYIVYGLLADLAAATALEADSVIKGKFKTAQVMTEPVLANVLSFAFSSMIVTIVLFGCAFVQVNPSSCVPFSSQVGHLHRS